MKTTTRLLNKSGRVNRRYGAGLSEITLLIRQFYLIRVNCNQSYGPTKVVSKFDLVSLAGLSVYVDHRANSTFF
jgi:hypothetical protein